MRVKGDEHTFVCVKEVYIQVHNNKLLMCKLLPLYRIVMYTKQLV